MTKGAQASTYQVEDAADFAAHRELHDVGDRRRRSNVPRVAASEQQQTTTPRQLVRRKTGTRADRKEARRPARSLSHASKNDATACVPGVGVVVDALDLARFERQPAHLPVLLVAVDADAQRQEPLRGAEGLERQEVAAALLRVAANRVVQENACIGNRTANPQANDQTLWLGRRISRTAEGGAVRRDRQKLGGRRDVKDDIPTNAMVRKKTPTSVSCREAGNRPTEQAGGIEASERTRRRTCRNRRRPFPIAARSLRKEIGTAAGSALTRIQAA